MSDDLAALVVSSAGPATVDEMLREAMARLRAEYSQARLHSVQLTFAVCDRQDLPTGRRYTQEMHWTVQADNEHGRGSSSREAFKDLAEEMAEKAQVPDFATRVAAVLRDVPYEGFARQNVLNAAQHILDEERRHGR